MTMFHDDLGDFAKPDDICMESVEQINSSYKYLSQKLEQIGAEVQSSLLLQAEKVA